MSGSFTFADMFVDSLTDLLRSLAKRHVMDMSIADTPYIIDVTLTRQSLIHRAAVPKIIYSVTSGYSFNHDDTSAT